MAGLSPVLGAADPETGGAFLVAGPSQVIGKLGIGPESLDGVQLFSQGGLGKHGVQLPVARGAKLYLWTELSATGAGHQMVRCEPWRLTFAQRAGGWLIS